MNSRKLRNVSFVLLILAMIAAKSQQMSASINCSDYYVGVTHVWECMIQDSIFGSCTPFDGQACHDSLQSFCDGLSGHGAYSTWADWSVYPQSFTWVQEVGYYVDWAEIRCEYAEY